MTSGLRWLSLTLGTLLKFSTLASAAAVATNDTNCNFVDRFPVDVCFLRRDRDGEDPRSRIYVCIEDSESGEMKPMRYTYKESSNCTGDYDERDESDENYNCDGDSTCPYLKYISRSWTTNECEGDPSLQSETLLIVNNCVGEDEDTLYLCNENRDNFWDCNCDGACLEQNILIFDECGDVDNVGSSLNELIDCPQNNQDFREATASPLPEAGCNFIGLSPPDVCYETSSQNGIQSRMYECKNGIPYRMIYEGVSDCSNDPSETEEWTDVRYDCEQSNNCDYLLVRNTVYSGDDECSEDVNTYVSESIRAIDACVGTGQFYQCNDDGSNYEVCDCDGNECEMQGQTFDECGELSVIFSSIASLIKCGEFGATDAPNTDSGVVGLAVAPMSASMLCLIALAVAVV